MKYHRLTLGQVKWLFAGFSYTNHHFGKSKLYHNRRFMHRFIVMGQEDYKDIKRHGL